MSLDSSPRIQSSPPSPGLASGRCMRMPGQRSLTGDGLKGLSSSFLVNSLGVGEKTYRANMWGFRRGAIVASERMGACQVLGSAACALKSAAQLGTQPWVVIGALRKLVSHVCL